MRLRRTQVNAQRNRTTHPSTGIPLNHSKIEIKSQSLHFTQFENRKLPLQESSLPVFAHSLNSF